MPQRPAYNQRAVTLTFNGSDPLTSGIYDFDELNGCTQMVVRRWIPRAQPTNGFVMVYDAAAENVIEAIPVRSTIEGPMELGWLISNPLGGFYVITSDIAMSGDLVVEPVAYLAHGANPGPPDPPDDPPDFRLFTQPSATTVSAGQSTTITVGIVALNGFLDMTTLSCEAVSGISYTITPNPAPPDGFASVLVQTTTGAPLGTTTIDVTGVSGILQHTTNFELTINPAQVADFTLSANPTAQTVQAGSQTTFTISNAVINGFSGSVALTITSSLPSGVSLVSFSPNPMAAGGSSTLTLATTTGATLGTHTVTITGTSGALVHTVDVGLQITAPQDFTLGATPSSQNVVAGNGTTYTISNTALNGFTGNVTLSCTPPHGSIGVSFSPNPMSAGGSSTLTVTTTAGTPATTHTLTINGVSGSLSDSVNVSLVVTAASNPDFTLTAVPTSRTIQAGASTTFTISHTDIDGFAGAVDLDCTPGISGVSVGGITNDPQGSGVSSVITFNTTTGATLGTHDITITGTSGALNHDVHVSLQITAPPDFSMSASAPQTVNAGSSASYTISNSILNGFSGAVTLSCTPGVSGVSLTSITPNPQAAGASSTLILATTIAATQGTHSITVTGTSGALVHTVPISLTINGPPDFSFSVNPSSANVTQGSSTTVTVSNTALNGFSGTITLAATPAISGVTYGFNPQPMLAGASSVFTITAGATATTGQTTLTITGTSGSLVKTAPLVLNVLGAGSENGTAQIQMRNPTSIAATNATFKAYIRCPDYTPYVIFDYRAVGSTTWIGTTPIGRTCHYRWANYYMHVTGLTAATNYEYRVRVFDLATGLLINSSENLASGTKVVAFTTRPAADVSQWNNRNITSGVTMPTYALPGSPASGLITEANPRQFTSIAQRNGGSSIFDIVVYGTDNPSGKTPGTVELYDHTGLIQTKSYSNCWMANAIKTDAKIGSVIGLEGFDGLRSTYHPAVQAAFNAIGYTPIYDGGGPGVTGAAWGCEIGGSQVNESQGKQAFWKTGSTYICVTGISIVGADMTQPSKLAVLSTAANPHVVAGEPVFYANFGSAMGGCNNVYFKNIKWMSTPGNAPRIPSGGADAHLIDTTSSQATGLLGFYDCEFRSFRENLGTISVDTDANGQADYTNQEGWGSGSHMRMIGNCRIDCRNSRASWNKEHWWYNEGTSSDMSGTDGSWFIGLSDHGGMAGIANPNAGFFRQAWQLTTRASPDSFKLDGGPDDGKILHIHQLISASAVKADNYIDGAPGRGVILIKNCNLNGEANNSYPYTSYGHLGEIIVENVTVGRGAGFGVQCDVAKGHYMKQEADGFWYAHGRLWIKSLIYASNVKYASSALLVSGCYDVQIDSINGTVYTGANFISHYVTGQSGKNGNADTSYPVDDGPTLGPCGKWKNGFNSATASTWAGGTYSTGEFQYRFGFGDEDNYTAAETNVFDGVYRLRVDATGSGFFNPT